MNLFQSGTFTLHSGAPARWKIDCDSLTLADWDTLALMLSEILSPFGTVEGIPRGGLLLARAMERYATSGLPLIVDDVATTGRSFTEFRGGRDAIGAVVFARGVCLPWVTPLFQMTTRTP